MQSSWHYEIVNAFQLPIYCKMAIYNELIVYLTILFPFKRKHIFNDLFQNALECKLSKY